MLPDDAAWRCLRAEAAGRGRRRGQL